MRKRTPAKSTKHITVEGKKVKNTMTIPGKAYTLRAIYDQLQGGVVAKHLARDGQYSGDTLVNDANSVDMVDAFKKIELVNREVELLKKNKADQAKAEEKEKYRLEIIEEYKKQQKEEKKRGTSDDDND
jgi:hypothetical protein